MDKAWGILENLRTYVLWAHPFINEEGIDILNDDGD